MSQSSPSLADMHALLGDLLDLPSAEQGAWLARLRVDQPLLAPALEALLAAEWQLDQRQFLEHGPAAQLHRTTGLAGQLAGSYMLDRLLGDGGMGSVWLAHPRGASGDVNGEAVAIKLLNLERLTSAGSARFRREGRALSRLSHPGICRFIEAGVTQAGQPYLALEFVDGEPIDRYCNDNRLPAAARISLVLQVIEALEHAHARRVIHRDIKPSNILVTTRGAARLMDFGIAKLLRQDPSAPESTGISKAGSLPLTPSHAAPEQVTGGDVTAAADVYSLGVLLYQLMGASHPTGPNARTAAEHIWGVLRTVPPRLSTVLRREAGTELRSSIEELRALYAAGLDEILARALEKSPELRYPSAAALGEELERWMKARA